MSDCDKVRAAMDTEASGIVLPCCESCHEDRDRGFEMSWMDIPGEPEPVEVCCAMARAYRQANGATLPAFPAYEA